MFYSLTGKVINKGLNYAVISCGGVGFMCHTSRFTLYDLPDDKSEATVYTHLNVREDALDLFGFSTEYELEWFKMLITVNGVGPKAATAILSVFNPDKLAITILNEDTKAIAKANGIGAKTAARIVLELKDKISKTYSESISAPTQTSSRVASAPVGSSKLSDAQSALLVLGYTKSEVVAALRGVDISNKNTDDIIRLALKNLSR